MSSRFPILILLVLSLASSVAASESGKQGVSSTKPTELQTETSSGVELASEPSTAAEARLVGLGALNLNRCDQALKGFERALALEPGSATALADRSMAFACNWASDKAAQDIEAAARINPHAADLFRAKSYLDLTKPDYNEAISYLSLEIQRDPTDIGMLRTRSWIYLQVGDLKRALFDCDAALSQRTLTGTEYIRVTFDKAVILEKWGRAGEATKLINGLGKLYPNIAESDYLIAEFFLQRKDYPAALEWIDRSVEIQPNDLKYDSFRSNALIKTGRLVEAQASLASLRRRSGANAEILNSLCWTQATNNLDLEMALSDCNQALKLAPQNPSVIDSLGFTLLRRSKYQEAITTYNAALAIFPGSASSLLGRSLAERQLGQADASRGDWMSALSRDPHIVEKFTDFGVIQ